MLVSEFSKLVKVVLIEGVIVLLLLLSLISTVVLLLVLTVVATVVVGTGAKNVSNKAVKGFLSTYNMHSKNL